MTDKKYECLSMPVMGFSQLPITSHEGKWSGPLLLNTECTGLNMERRGEEQKSSFQAHWGEAVGAFCTWLISGESDAGWAVQLPDPISPYFYSALPMFHLFIFISCLSCNKFKLACKVILHIFPLTAALWCKLGWEKGRSPVGQPLLKQILQGQYR